MRPESSKDIHPTVKKCLQHIDVLQTDDKTKQIVYMYMEALLLESAKSAQLPNLQAEVPIQAEH